MLQGTGGSSSCFASRRFAAAMAVMIITMFPGVGFSAANPTVSFQGADNGGDFLNPAAGAGHIASAGGGVAPPLLRAVGGSGYFRGTGGSGIYVEPGDVFSSGRADFHGGDGGDAGLGGCGIHIAAGSAVNKGRLSAKGGSGFGSGGGGDGFFLAGGGVVNHESVSAFGGGAHDSGSFGGTGIYSERGSFYTFAFLESRGGEATGTFAMGGNGIYLKEGNFSNFGKAFFLGGSGTVGGFGGRGMYVLSGQAINNGYIQACGGSGNVGGGQGGEGFRLDGGGLANSGVIAAMGGDGLNGGWGGNGITVRGVFANSGSIAAHGGGSSYGGFGGNGVQTNVLINNGELVVLGGSAANNGYGLFVEELLVNNNKLVLSTGALAPSSSVYVRGVTASDSLALGGGSVLSLRGGRIEVLNGNTLISADARLDARLPQASALKKGDMLVHSFISHQDSDLGVITGVFNMAPSSSPTLRYGLKISDDNKEMSLKVSRVAYASQLTGGSASSVLASVENGLLRQGVAKDNLAWAKMMADVDASPDLGSLKRTASETARKISPQAFSGAFDMLLDMFWQTNEIFSREMRQAGGAFAADGNRPGRVFFWAEPFAKQASRDSENTFYSSLDWRFGGASIGAAMPVGNVVLGLSGWGAAGKIDGGGFDADSESFGVNAGIGGFLHRTSDLRPWASVQIGWNRTRFDQTREDCFGASHSSSPKVDVYSAATTLGGVVSVDSLSLMPEAGVGYARLRLKPYSEGKHGMELQTDSADYDSLRGFVALSAQIAATKTLHLRAKAGYAYEFMDTRIELDSSSGGGAFSFTTKGQDSGKNRGGLGASAMWKPSERLSFSMDYEWGVARRYRSHQGGLAVMVTF